MTIFKEIQDLLFNNDCVIIPEFGAFILKSHSAYIQNNNFYPPKKSISFNSMLNENDGLLVKYISTNRKISYKKALKIITDEAQSLNKNLSRFRKIDIELLKLIKKYLPDEINDNAWSKWTEKIISQTNVKPKTLYMDLRFILTGRKFGPSMNNLLTLFQREEILRRIELNCE